MTSVLLLAQVSRRSRRGAHTGPPQQPPPPVDPTPTPGPAAVNSVAPAVTPAGPVVTGAVLTCDGGTWLNLTTPKQLQWQTAAGTNLQGQTSSQLVTPAPGSYRCRVTGQGGTGTAAVVAYSNTVVVLTPTPVGDPPPPLGEVEKATGKTATAQSPWKAPNETGNFDPGQAVDDNAATRFSTLWGVDNRWWQVDLGAATLVKRVEIDWYANYASTYKIQTSLDGATWTDRASVAISAAGLKVTSFTEISARYVRVLCLTRAVSAYGCSFYSVKVYGTADAGAPTAAPTFTTAPGITGTPQVGATLTCDGGVASSPAGAVTKTFLWFGDGASLGVTTATWTPTQTYATYDCQVTATAGGQSTSVLATKTGAGSIAAAPPPPPPAQTEPVLATGGSPVASGNVVAGQQITCTSGQWTQVPTTITGQRQRWNGSSWVNDGAPTTTWPATFTTANPGDVGAKYRWSIVATNSTGPSIAALSNELTIEAVPVGGGTMQSLIDYDMIGTTGGQRGLQGTLTPVYSEDGGPQYLNLDWGKHPQIDSATGFRTNSDRSMVVWGMVYEQGPSGNPSACKNLSSYPQGWVHYDNGAWWKSHGGGAGTWNGTLGGAMAPGSFAGTTSGTGSGFQPANPTNAPGGGILLKIGQDTGYALHWWHNSRVATASGPQAYSSIKGVMGVIFNQLDPATPGLHATAKYSCCAGFDSYVTSSGAYTGGVVVGRFKTSKTQRRAFTNYTGARAGETWPPLDGQTSTSELV